MFTLHLEQPEPGSSSLSEVWTGDAPDVLLLAVGKEQGLELPMVDDVALKFDKIKGGRLLPRRMHFQGLGIDPHVERLYTPLRIEGCNHRDDIVESGCTVCHSFFSFRLYTIIQTNVRIVKREFLYGASALFLYVSPN